MTKLSAAQVRWLRSRAGAAWLHTPAGVKWLASYRAAQARVRRAQLIAARRASGGPTRSTLPLVAPTTPGFVLTRAPPPPSTPLPGIVTAAIGQLAAATGIPGASAVATAAASALAAVFGSESSSAQNFARLPPKDQQAILIASGEGDQSSQRVQAASRRTTDLLLSGVLGGDATKLREDGEGNYVRIGRNARRNGGDMEP